MSSASPADQTPPHLKPILRGWLHVVGVVALVACSPILFSRARTWAQVGWVLCYVVGVGAMMNRISWSWCIAAIGGITLSFGAPQIVTWIRGMFAV